MRRAHKVDGNQAVIAEALRKAGCTVHVCSRYGGGWPDLLCKGPVGTRYIEIKMPGERGSLTKDQREFFGVYFDVYIVVSEAEALEVMGVGGIWDGYGCRHEPHPPDRAEFKTSNPPKTRCKHCGVLYRCNLNGEPT